MQRVLLASLIAMLASVAADALAQTGCTRTEIKRAVPGGDEVPAFRIDCEEAPDEGLLAADALERVRGSSGLGPGEVAACEEAVYRAQAALRKAKLRAALRDGCKIARSARNLERIRTEWRVTESTKRLNETVVDALIAGTGGARSAYIRCWSDPHQYLWRVDCAEFLRAFDLLKYLPQPFGEYEVADENASWYLRLRDDDPFIFVAGPAELVDLLERNCKPFSLRVDGGFLYAA